MLWETLQVMKGWDFAYKSHFIWLKRESSKGYCNREQHELLLIGVRGNVPAPALGEDYLSLQGAEAADKKWAKPTAFVDIIEAMFPNATKIGRFAEEPRSGWNVWGNEGDKSTRAARRAVRRVPALAKSGAGSAQRPSEARRVGACSTGAATSRGRSAIS
jgi:N6-adenosine-specific RNA methylase IME4